MQAPNRRRGVPSLALRNSLRWLVVSLIAATLSACGGGSATQDTPVTGPVPGATTTAFAIMPARLGLAGGGQATLLALRAPGALIWSSSNPAVASVDAQGQVSALAEGDAVITATSGSATASSSVKVYPTTASTGGALIATALAQNRISAEQALTYQVFVLFGDERLPAEFEGPPDTAPSHLLLRELMTTIGSLSTATQDVLRPFLIPPIYVQSWFAQRLGLAASATAAPQSAQVSRKTRLAVDPFICNAIQFPYQQVLTEHFHIHYLGGNFAADGTEAVVAMLATLLEEVYTADTGLLKRLPLDDSRQACNGGDDKYDVYYIPAALGGVGAYTTTYLRAADAATVVNACANQATYMMINSMSAEFLAAAHQPERARPMVKSILAHEFLHALQLAMERQASCDDTKWFDEATAQWVMDHVVRTIPQGDPGEFGMEPGVGNVASNFPKSGPVLAEYLYSEHMVSIEKPGAQPKLNGYADYLFFQFLARSKGPATIKQIFDAMAGGKNSLQAIAAAVDMKATWPEFAKTLWIGVTDKVLDYWNTEDQYRFGLADVYAQVPTALPADLSGARDRLKSLEIDQKGQKSAKFELLANALAFSGNYEIDPRSMIYEHLKFTDATVHYVQFENPLAGDPSNGSMKLQALKKIGGHWGAAEDWTQDAVKLFCLDKKDERLEELLLIVSNSELSAGSREPYRISTDTPMRVSTSNVGCWRWAGTASTTTNWVDGPQTVESVVGAVFDVFRLPGQGRNDVVGLDTFRSSNAGTAGYSISGPLIGTGCTISGSASSQLQGDGQLLADGSFIVSYLLPGTPLDRTAIGSGTTNIPLVTQTTTCGGRTETSTGPRDVRWLSWPTEGVPVSEDGQTITGRWDRTDADGAKTSVWNLRSVRE